MKILDSPLWMNFIKVLKSWKPVLYLHGMYSAMFSSKGYVLLSCRGWLKMSRSVLRGHYFLYFCKIDKEDFVMEKCKVGGGFLSQISLYLIYTRFQRICPFSFSFDSFILLNYLHSISPVHFMVGATDYHHVKTTPFLWLVKIDYIHHISKYVFFSFWMVFGFLFTFELS